MNIEYQSISNLLLFSLFFLDGLLANKLFSLELDVLSLLLHVQIDHLVELLFVIGRVHVPAEHQRFTAILIVSLGLIQVSPTSCLSRYGSDSDILVQEVLISEVIQESCQVNHGPLTVLIHTQVILSVDHVVLNLLYHGISDLLENAREYLVMIFAFELWRDCLSELLIHLLSNSTGPADHLIIYQLNPLVQVLSLLALLFQSIDLVV